MSAAQNPLVATDASPPSATPMAPAKVGSFSTVRRYATACAWPAAGVYCVPTPPHIGSAVAPSGFG